jgi:hypothetical protein
VSRRGAILTALALFAGAAGTAATMASATPSYPPEPCPPQPLIWQQDGNFYVSIPTPQGPNCRTVVEVPGNIKKPAAGSAQALPPIRGCPPGPIFYEYQGHDYVTVPDPTGQQCRMTIELPITLPPT